MDRSYKRAIELLNRRQRPSRPVSAEPATSFPGLNRIPVSDGEAGVRGKPGIWGMKQWLDELGHSAAEIDRLNIIHVAGTKGKGSTCAFIDSMLRAHGKRAMFPSKVGLYTSPHLIHPEERIRINFDPLPRDLFARYFFEVDDVFSRARPSPVFETRPRRLQLFALLCFHTFLRERVDAAVIETHHGGEYDCTNVIEKPLVTAITTLGMDHVKQLGPSLENIAWHKAGIFKPGAAAFSSPQEDAAAEVLRQRASEKGVDLQFVTEASLSPFQSIQLWPEVQRTNFRLAIAVVRSFLEQKNAADGRWSRLSDLDVLDGYRQFSWPGRFQIVTEGQNLHWFLDSAHNEMSVPVAAEWFLEVSRMQQSALGSSSIVRILIFSLISDQRDGAAVFERLADSLTGSDRDSDNEINHVIFTTYKRDQDQDQDLVDSGNNLLQPQLWETKSPPDRQLHERYASIWQEKLRKRAPQLQGQPHNDDESVRSRHTHFEPTIQQALEKARKLSGSDSVCKVLITGSQHLVGGALSLLQQQQQQQTQEKAKAPPEKA